MRDILGPTVKARINDPIPADPTHHQADNPVAIAQPRRADRRNGADVDREQCRKNKPGVQFPAGDKKIAALMHTSGEDYAERDHQSRIADENGKR